MKMQTSPKGATLLHSPGRKPWVNCFHTFPEPRRGGTHNVHELHEEKTRLAFPKLKNSAKSVQTTAEVYADYTCSLYRLQLKSPESATYL